MLYKFKRVIKNPSIVRNVILWNCYVCRVKLSNTFHESRRPSTVSCSLNELIEINNRRTLDTDMSDHLPHLFAISMLVKPELIVELGVRDGDSTFVLERVARLNSCPLISVDLDDCSAVTDWKDWHFVQQDDISFAREFSEYCSKLGLRNREIDVLFLDTSHLYDHTVQELEHWIPLLSKKGCLILHDTNHHRSVQRQDGRAMLCVENREVTSALEKYFCCQLDTVNDFITVHSGWLISHRACSYGFTVIQRI